MFSSARLHLLAPTFVVLLLAVGCGSETEGDRTPDIAAKPAADAARPVIGVSLPAATQGWHAGVARWAEQTIAEYDEIDWHVQHASDPGEQVAQMEAMLRHGLDALVLLPMDAAAPLDVVRKAKATGVYVVSVNRGLEEPMADLHVVGDNAAFGRIGAEFIVEQLDFQGKIVILRGLPGEIDTDRYEAATNVFEAHPGVEVLDTQRGNGNQEDAHQVMQAMLAEHDAIDAVWASDDAMALGVEQAIHETGRTQEMWILGGGGMKEVVARVRDEDPLYPADVTYPSAVITAGLHLAVAQVLYDGDEQSVADRLPDHLGIDPADLLGATEPRSGNQRRLVLPVYLVTPENAKDYYSSDSVY